MLLTNYYKSHKIERDNRIGIRKAEDKNGENRKDNKDTNSSKNDNGDEDRGVSSRGGQKAERLGGHGDEGGLGRGGGYLGTGSDDSPEREIWQRLRQDHSADFLAEDDWERLRPNLSEGKAVLRPCAQRRGGLQGEAPTGGDGLLVPGGPGTAGRQSVPSRGDDGGGQGTYQEGPGWTGRLNSAGGCC